MLQAASFGCHLVTARLTAQLTNIELYALIVSRYREQLERNGSSGQTSSYTLPPNHPHTWFELEENCITVLSRRHKAYEV